METDPRSKKDDIRDWCPICCFQALNTKKLAIHMKDQHKRYILEKDINRAEATRHARIRAIEVADEALLA